MTWLVVMTVFSLSAAPFEQFVKEAESVKNTFEGDEAEFFPELLGDLPIQGTEDTPDFRTCQESGQFERLFSQTLMQEEIAQTKQVKKCLGHNHILIEKVPEHQMKNTKKRIQAIQAQYAQNPQLKKSSITAEYHKRHNDIFASFEHIDDAAACDHFTQETVSAPPKIADTWTTDDPANYNTIKNSPHCHIAATQQKDKTHRDLLFICAPSAAESQCAQLRELGGVLVSKRCIHQNPETDECELWEKTFNLSRRAPPTQTPRNNEFDHLKAKYTPNEDLPQIRAIFSSLSEMPIGEGEKMLNWNQETEIFNAEERGCAESRKVGEVFDCCKDMSGCIGCSENEKKLRQMRDEGRCHYVGHYNDGLLDLKRNRVFCCFPTKLLRIFSEKMRAQMFGKDTEAAWGTPKKPRCNGISLEQMSGKVDVSLFDLSETAADFAVDETKIMAEMEEELREAIKLSEGQHIFKDLIDETTH